MPSTGPAADAARAAFREQMEAKGHAVENARAAVDGLEAAFAVGRPRSGRRRSTRCSPTSRSRSSRTRARSSAASAPRPRGSSCARSPASWTTPDGRRARSALDSRVGRGFTIRRMDDDLLPIGRFARLTGLTIGALRHYDELGVLAPADVDPVTGYRRYRRDQVETARAIAALRDLELSLAGDPRAARRRRPGRPRRDPARRARAARGPDGPAPAALHRLRVLAATQPGDPIRHEGDPRAAAPAPSSTRRPTAPSAPACTTALDLLEIEDRTPTRTTR